MTTLLDKNQQYDDFFNPILPLLFEIQDEYIIRKLANNSFSFQKLTTARKNQESLFLFFDKIPLREMFFRVIYQIFESPKCFCPSCNNLVKWDSTSYNKFCSRECKYIFEYKMKDENGSSIQRLRCLKGIKTRAEDVDENGLNGNQRLSLKGAETSRQNIDENGLNGIQRQRLAATKTMKSNIDENGLDGFQRATLKMIETKVNDIDENGFSSLKRGALKAAETKRTTILKDGTTSIQKAGNNISIALSKKYNTLRIQNKQDYSGFVYIVSFSKYPDVIKIGLSFESTEKRIKSLEPFYGEAYIHKIIIASMGCYELETKLHTQFEKFRKPLDEKFSGYTEFFDKSILDEVLLNF